MFVDTQLLHAGANDSHRAGAHAQDAAEHLARGPLASGMFGNFAAAEDFHEALSSAHTQHVNALQAHHEALSAVGSKAHIAARGFTEMDQRNAVEMRSVREGFGRSAPK